MLADKRNRRFGWVAAAMVGAVGLCALAVPLAPAQSQVPYLGVDFGNGFGIGVGVPPSAYGMAPAPHFSFGVCTTAYFYVFTVPGRASPAGNDPSKKWTMRPRKNLAASSAPP